MMGRDQGDSKIIYLEEVGSSPVHPCMPFFLSMALARAPVSSKDSWPSYQEPWKRAAAS